MDEIILIWNLIDSDKCYKGHNLKDILIKYIHLKKNFEQVLPVNGYLYFI